MADKLLPLRRALLSVSDKTGLVELARALAVHGVELVSTGGTARTLRAAGLAVREVDDLTDIPEMMDGRVKTLHPHIHGGLLGRAGLDEAVMAEYGIAPIDLLVVNLYPFAEATAREDCTLAEAVEHIDIGGPAMLRSAAKNFARVAVLTAPAQYADVLAELDTHHGALSANTRFALAVTAFNQVARYDAAISDYLSSITHTAPAIPERTRFPAQLNLNLNKAMALRYGENPHQRGAFYRDPKPIPGTLASFIQVQGKDLSYNNLADADAAWECARGFYAPACVIVKHANPCGVAVAEDLDTAYERAHATDPTSAFGGIIAFNRPLDAATVNMIVQRQFVEVLIASGYSDDALAVLTQKPNLRVLRIPLPADGEDAPWQVCRDFKRIGGGWLVQDADTITMDDIDLRTVSQRSPTAQELDDLDFAWQVAKYVKSNAIVLARERRSIGIGAGQMSRVISARIAAIKAEEAGLPVAGAVLASDAFFPFRDGLDAAAGAGITAIIQPGGSIRDDEVIAAADEHGIAMLFTGIRHFRH